MSGRDWKEQNNSSVTVSVVVAFFNAEKFLAETIESVLAQTYSRWELLLVDDGSTDASFAIATRYARVQPGRIMVIQHIDRKNLGVCVSRNLGIQRARGKYIAILDADDVWYPNKLADQVEIMGQYPQAGMVCGAVLNWRNWDEKNLNQEKDEIRPTGAPQNSLIMPPMLSQYLYPLGPGMAPSPSDLMIKKDVLIKIGGFEEVFTQEYQLFEDQGFLSKIYLNAPVYVSDRVWTKYRRHDEQCMTVSRKTEKFHYIREFYFRWLKSYLIQQGYKGTKIWSLMQKELFAYDHPVLFEWKNRLEKIFANLKHSKNFRQLP